MNRYDTRHLTLDPGLTVLALRGLQRRDGHYPFIDAWRQRREAVPTGGPAWKALLRALATMSVR
jgi:hypothetical protein